MERPVQGNRQTRWLQDLEEVLRQGADLASRGYDAYSSDPALPLAMEALCVRAGEIARRLITADPDHFSDEIWTLVARNRDFLAHHYDRIDIEMLWATVNRDFPALRQLVLRASNENT